MPILSAHRRMMFRLFEFRQLERLVSQFFSRISSYEWPRTVARMSHLPATASASVLPEIFFNDWITSSAGLSIRRKT